MKNKREYNSISVINMKFYKFQRVIFALESKA